MNISEHQLILIAEEAGELVKEISKLIRFGPDERLTPDHPTNRQRVQDELWDLIIVANDAGFFTIPPRDHIIKKAKAVDKYLRYSVELGRVSL